MAPPTDAAWDARALLSVAPVICTSAGAGAAIAGWGMLLGGAAATGAAAADDAAAASCIAACGVPGTAWP